MSDGEIETVVITGAGASFPFGAPLMTGWCKALVTSLSDAAGYRQATGLAVDLPPEEFESRLGQFLHRVQAFNQIEPLVPLSLDFQQVPQTLTAQGMMQRWHENTAFHLRAIVTKIRESLYDLFAAANLDVPGAVAAYRGLFELLNIGVSSNRWVYATTNYDVLAESVISTLGGRPDWGELPQLGYGGQRELDVDHLVDSMPRSTPVVHLHGRVGWYRRPDGSVYATNTIKHDEQNGVPIVMMPDLDKAYADDGVISSLWAQFASALSRTRRVFIMGHSLHDRALLRVIQNQVAPDRVLVAVLADELDPAKPDATTREVIDIVDGLGWSSVPMRFGGSIEACREAVEAWLANTAEVPG